MGRLFGVILIGVLAGSGAMAQPTSSASVAKSFLVAPPLPSVPDANAPIDFFRHLLAMPAADRETVLATRTPPAREVLEARLKEFDALPPAAREARLQTLELRWLLLPLMKLSKAARAERLVAMPEVHRKIVAERLELWEQLSDDLQQKVLENEKWLGLFFRSETNPPPADLLVTNLPPTKARRWRRNWRGGMRCPKRNAAESTSTSNSSSN